MMFGSRSLMLVGITILLLQPVSLVRAQDEEEPDRVVRLDQATIALLGIQTTGVKAVQFQSEARGFGVVMAFDALAQADADLTTAEAAAATSKTSLARAQALFNANVSVSRQTVENAERQAAADQAQLALAERRSITTWGQPLPWRNPTERSALMARLTSGDLVLVRVTFPTSAVGPTIPTNLRIQRVDPGQGGATWTANRIWNAPADPNVPGRSFFALVDRARGLLPGERLIVSLPTSRTQQGVLIPSAALIIAEGTSWYYEREIVQPVIPLAPFYMFNRKKLDISQPMDDGYFVANGDLSQVVVVEGAGLILARETGTEEDED